VEEAEEEHKTTKEKPKLLILNKMATTKGIMVVFPLFLQQSYR
jgi:hypothetical protein